MANCPLCGAPHNWRELMRPPWERRATAEGWTRFSQFDAGTVKAAVQAGATYEKRRPTRAAKMESDVWVPLCQSLFSGVVGGVAAGAAAALAGESWRSLLYGAIGGAGSVGLAWVILLRDHRAGLWEIERIVGRDLDGDGHVGAPVTKREPVQVEVTQRDERGRLRMMRWFEFPVRITDADLAVLARALLVDGLSFSRRALEDVLSADKVSDIQNVLLKGQAAYYVNGKNASNGIELGSAGKRFLRQYLVVVGGGGR